MKENNGMAESKSLVADTSPFSDREVMLLTMFRMISTQQQRDVMRLLEVFMLVAKQ